MPFPSFFNTNVLMLVQPGQQLSQIEKSVTHLLIATKQLLETLTQWSRHTATEGEVSDVYVRLGYEFNIACRAFNGIGVDTSDLGPVPELLRAILEETLSQEASSASLDKFLPRIRDIIITLLHGLKRKQQRLRAKQTKETPANGNSLGLTASSSSLNTGLTQMLEDVPSQRTSGRASERRTGSGSSTLVGDMPNGDFINGDDHGVPPRYSSAPPARHNSGDSPGDAAVRNSNRTSQRHIPISLSDSSMSSVTSQSTSVLSPSSEGEINPTQHVPPVPREVSRNAPHLQPTPRPPPKQQDALAALQRGGDLERRASRRYSAYQISKHLGASPNGVPMLPPAQNSPIPNRGRDVRDSMNAVRTRGSGIYSHQRNNTRVEESSPVRNNNLANRISEESVSSRGTRSASEAPEDGNFLANEPYDMRTQRGKDLGNESPKIGATLTSPADGVTTYSDGEVESAEFRKISRRGSSGQKPAIQLTDENDQPEQQFVPEQSPQPGKDLTLFLQYKSKIKKFVLPEGSSDLSVARLQLAFIEKFAWNTHNNGNDLPEIYIQDPISGVRHELEDLNDVKDRSVLVLNVEALDEVKRHIDEGLRGLKRMVEGVRIAVDGQQNALQRVTERQRDTTREVARLSITPKSVPESAPSLSRSQANGPYAGGSSKAPADQVRNIQSLRQDLAVVRQTFTSLVSDMNNSMSTVQDSAASIKTMAIDGVMPNLDASTGRSYVNAGKKTLGEDSEKIVNRVDDLQDIVEDLRKDVVMRGVRPLPRQLETVSKSISNATAELQKMQEFLRKEKPIWTKIWEKELQLVCNDRDLLTMQEELAADLEDDLEKATQTFALVEQATKQQNLQSREGSGVALRSTSKGLAAIATAMDQDIDPMKAKDGVLGEVRALRPNHETRLEAIERAEKARRRELETRREGEFTKEVASFVEEGRLRKSGGIEEAERLRKAKDEKNRRTAWDTQQERASGKGKRAEDGPPAEPEHLVNPAFQDDETTEQEREEAQDEPAELREEGKRSIEGEPHIQPSANRDHKADPS